MVLHGEARERATYVAHNVVLSRNDRMVVIAHHEVFGGPCVQKTVLYSEHDGSIISEANMLDKLRHERLVEIREAQFDPDNPGFITFVMPYYPGGSVEEAISEGHRFGVRSAIQITRDLLAALSFLHNDFGLVHRDVKSGNLLLDAQRSRGFLSDLGSAAHADVLGQVPLAQFTIVYLDPATRYSLPMTSASDVYSAGIVLYEMLNNRVAYDGIDIAKAEARLASGKRPFVGLRFAPHVSGEVRRIVNKALCEDADRRFGSVGDFASALHALNVTDWTAETDSLHGEWSGVRRGSHSRDVVVKVAGELADGRSKGSVRLVALRETKGGWARFGIPDRLVKPENYPAAAKFFSAVEHKLDQLSATL